MQQCPSCQYELTMKEQVEAAESCPSCGVIYADFLREREEAMERRRRRLEEQGLEQLKRASPSHVVVTDIDMPFWSLVQFLVKLALAFVPAGLILMVIFWGFTSFIRLM
ncbi:hypothetical protein QQF45_17410 [Halopseudomonas aestusnigri]|uniref:hypothetical protein n=1 Tax=Halopseudomonas aestusnigri TaxID=857252 RepID=UPI0025559224|nr:hypothetical protein [Halopseudomonas aestusnigri]MDL2200822.1 hypothetical protein [Halopseudomonas aestusnigri]